MHSSKIKIPEKSANSVIDLALDTIEAKKQAIVFVGTKKGAEKTAEDIAKRIKTTNAELEEISDKILNALPKPTKQCERLALIIKKGIAFHHAGLIAKQKELIEDNFRKGIVRIICCTPTLCLAKNTRIWTGMSNTEIHNLKVSEPIFALSKNGLISMKAQKINRLTNSSKLIKISSAAGYSIEVTPRHKMLIKRGDKKRLFSAADIHKSDKIATAGKLNFEKISNPSIKQFVTNNALPIKNRFFDKDLSYFIGAMLGDGYSGAQTINKIIEYKGSPCIVGKDKEIFSEIIKTCDTLSISHKASLNAGFTPQLVLGKNKWFREVLVNCGIEQRDRKHISEQLLCMCLENISALLQGLFDTDGYVNKGKSVGFSSVSEKMILQIQKLLLRFGIVCRIRKRKAGLMKIYKKEYKTLPHFELSIQQNKSIVAFYRLIGFKVGRKQNDLKQIVTRINSNLNYVRCNQCRYTVHRDIFSGRSTDQKKWGGIKLKAIKLLGEKGEVGSRDLHKFLSHNPKKNETRLNHHYEFIKKRRVGSRSKTEWLWSLNKIGRWTYDNLLSQDKPIEDFIKLQKCPLCSTKLDLILKKSWRDSDFEGDIFWDIIKKIEIVNREEPFVFDVCLPNKNSHAHMFVAEGFIVHNSAGVDLPAFRTIIKDLKRYGKRGYDYITVLEYQQMSGRAGRPKFDSFGESISISASDNEKEIIKERFINGQPEEIFSKLAAEPVLRTYLLSLIAAEFVTTKKQIMDFFKKTFWAHQYKDMKHLQGIINKMLKLLEQYQFIKLNEPEFVPANEIDAKDKVSATVLGKRVAELYLDPLTADHIIQCLNTAASRKTKPAEIALLQMITHTLELRPLLSVKVKEWEEMQQKIGEIEEDLLEEEPSAFEDDYDEFAASVKTAILFEEWIEEKDEEFLLEKYNVRPGELHTKLDLVDWLLYSAAELARILKMQPLIVELVKLRMRINYGAKEELLPLLKLQNIGRARARKMFSSGIKDIADVKKTELSNLASILGKNIAIDVKKQVGQDFAKEIVPENKRKGQISLKDY